METWFKADQTRVARYQPLSETYCQLNQCRPQFTVTDQKAPTVLRLSTNRVVVCIVHAPKDWQITKERLALPQILRFYWKILYASFLLFTVNRLSSHLVPRNQSSSHHN